MSKDKCGEYSIVTTVFNDQENIGSLIKNIENQTYYPKEMIIVDGGSVDNTVQVINKYKQESLLNIRVLAGEKLNIAQGFNRGIREVNTEYIGIVACGNIYPKDFFEKLVSDLDSDKSLSVAYGSLSGSVNNKFMSAYCRAHFGKDNYVASLIPHNHGNLVRTELYKEEGLFYEKFSYAGEDMEFFLRIMNHGRRVYCNRREIIIWEVPENKQQYLKQLRNYCIGNAEIFSNYTLCKVYRKKIVYCLLYFVTCLFLIIPVMLTRYIGLLSFTILVIVNFGLFLKNGKDYFIIKQLGYIYWLIVLLKNPRLLTRKEKIDNPMKYYI